MSYAHILVLLLFQFLSCNHCGSGQHLHHNNHQHSHTSEQTHFDLASNASNNYFSDVTNYHWLIKATIHCEESSLDLQEGKIMSTQSREYYIANQWNNYFFVTHEPTFSCGYERKIGSRGDGGKWVCDPHRIHDSRCLVYSIGSNNQFDFEEGIYERLHCETHTFDPTVDGKALANPRVTTFHRMGISNQAQANSKTFFTIGKIIDSLGHSNQTIDVFKIDCEGCEYSLFTEEFFSELKSRNVKLRQILIEIHPFQWAQMTATEEVNNFFKLFQRNGYVIFHKELNNMQANAGRCVEYSFLLIEGLDCADLPRLQDKFGHRPKNDSDPSAHAHAYSRLLAEERAIIRRRREGGEEAAVNS